MVMLIYKGLGRPASGVAIKLNARIQSATKPT